MRMVRSVEKMERVIRRSMSAVQWKRGGMTEEVERWWPILLVLTVPDSTDTEHTSQVTVREFTVCQMPIAQSDCLD